MSHCQKPPSRKKGGEVFVLAVLDPYQGPSGLYNFKKDSSHLLLLSLCRRGYKIYYSDPSSLVFFDGRLRVCTRQAAVLEGEPYFTFGEEEFLPAEDFSLILMRKDPPVDQGYLHATHLLSLVSDKVWVLNSPEALRNWNEKLVILQFPRWIPPTLVTAGKEEINRFVRKQGGSAIAKPLDGFAGKGTRKLCRKDEDTPALLDEMTLDGCRSIMVQEFLPEVSGGEKRIFMIDGRPLGALLKIPPEGEFLANPDLGGRLAPTGLTSGEKRLCAELAPFLIENGIFFAGIDVIGGRLTEINITSPGLLWEWNEVDNRRHEEEIVDQIEKRLK